MGWDNASTIAQEVERPQLNLSEGDDLPWRSFLFPITYVLPFLAVYFTGTPASAFAEDGSWAAIAGATRRKAARL